MRSIISFPTNGQHPWSSILQPIQGYAVICPSEAVEVSAIFGDVHEPVKMLAPLKEAMGGERSLKLARGDTVLVIADGVAVVVTMVVEGRVIITLPETRVDKGRQVGNIFMCMNVVWQALT